MIFAQIVIPLSLKHNLYDWSTIKGGNQVKQLIRGFTIILFILFSLTFIIEPVLGALTITIKDQSTEIQINKEDKLIKAGKISGIVMNESPNNYTDIRVRVRINTKNAMPVEPAGKDMNIELFADTGDVIYHIDTLVVSRCE